MLVTVPSIKNWHDSSRIHKIAKDVAKAELDSNYKQQFRVSSLPFCPLFDIMESKNTVKKINFSQEFYFSIGKAIHNLYQKYSQSAHPTQLIGDWKCERVLSASADLTKSTETRCAKTYSFCSLKTAKKQHVCPHKVSECKKRPQFHYEELQILARGLSGHVDLLYKINGKYYLVDIKTTSNFLFNDTDVAIKRGYYPSKKYWHQIESYCYLIEKKFNVKIEQYAILYMGREKPSSNQVDFHLVFAKKFSQADRKQRGKILKMQWTFNEQYQKFMRTKSKKVLNVIYDNRPCQSKKEHNTLMKHKFFEGHCPFWKDGSCPSGKIKRNIMETAK